VEALVCTASSWTRAPSGGLFRSHRELGALVERDEALGVIADPFGDHEVEVRSTRSGIVIGRSHPLAHAAARQVAEGRRGDAVMFNPLYIHAGVGLGTTHLLQAVTWAGNSGSERRISITRLITQSMLPPK